MGINSHSHTVEGPRWENLHFLEKLCYSAKPHCTPHVWFAVIRPAKQPALKMPFNEKRLAQPPWHLLGVAGGIKSSLRYRLVLCSEVFIPISAHGQPDCRY